MPIHESTFAHDPVSRAPHAAPMDAPGDLGDARAAKVLGLVAADRREGAQFSLYGIKGMPPEGLDALSPANLTMIESALEPQYLGAEADRLSILFREGLTFEIVSRAEALLYREDRQREYVEAGPTVIPELRDNALVRKALEKTIVAGGRGSHADARRIAALLGIPEYNTIHTKFANSEASVKLPDSVRGHRMIIVQTFAGDIDIGLASTRLLMDAASRAGIQSITVALPYLPYGRQDRRGKERTSVTLAQVIAELEAAGRGRLKEVVTVDMHALQLEGMTSKVNLDNLSGQSLFIKPLRAMLDGEEFAVVFPDAGARKRAEEDHFDVKLETAFSVPPRIGTMAKTKSAEKRVTGSRFEGDPEIIRGKTVVFFDDMIDTGGTALASVEVVRQLGAKRVIYCATHPLFSQCGVELFRNATVADAEGNPVRAVDKVLVSNSVPLRRGRGDLIETVDVFPMLSHFLAGVVSDGGFSTRELAKTYSGLNGH